MKGTYNNLNLHVCVYYPEHRIMAEKLYGKGRVAKQLEKERIKTCGECRFLDELCEYVGITNAPEDIKDDSNFSFANSKISHKYRDEKELVVTVDKVYTEKYMDLDEFFEPPEPNKRWADML